jgi:hypothetical protein
MVEVYLHYYLMYNYMFRLLTIAVFRLYMNPQKVVIQDLIWAVYSGDVGDEVDTRSRRSHGGWGGTAIMYT